MGCIFLKKDFVMKRDHLITQINCLKKIIFACLALIPLLNSLKVAGQEEFIEPQSRLLTHVPFHQLTGGVILFKALLDTFPDTLNFVLDTGSSGISLDSATVEHLKLHPIPSDKTIRGIAGIKKVSFLYDRKLHLNGLTVDSLNFHVNDYGILTSVYGEKVDGVVGYSFLSRYIVRIDYDSSVIQVFSKGSFDYPKGGYLFKPILNSLPIQNLKLKDARTARTRFLFDIGAGLCMILTQDLVNDSSLLKRKRKLWLKQAEGLGGRLDMDLTVIKEVKVGPYKFKKVPVYIFNDVYDITSYPYLGGLIGNDVLRRFNVILNYGKRDIYLMPNSHFSEAFDYSYSGLDLYLIDKAIVVGDVAKGSPADKAGLKEDDVIISINDNISQSLAQYKAALQSTGAKIHIIVKRNGELKEFYFKIKSIL